ncbi:hypothetical protein WH95_02375 [Kiloniella litopenaei]|uniref:Lipoprotein n=1 Tax=Kiloniella litopenaei TaxID=1549748 RepID=A0A0M2RCQ3_9PROT|nr:hypothetical protein [Kiloniella litopenaei]KKJ78204.1 hypothetical protein WH95_02375 [Kiloniella litopenaei]
MKTRELMMRIVQSFFTLLVIVTLSGCGQNVFQKEEVVVVSKPQPTTYCYRSLANVDCYEQPVPEEERTLLVPVE